MRELRSLVFLMRSFSNRRICLVVYFIHLPMKMEPIVSSETSAIRTQKPGNYPKRNKLQLYYNCQYAKTVTTWVTSSCRVYLNKVLIGRPNTTI